MPRQLGGIYPLKILQLDMFDNYVKFGIAVL